jgi:hypothetical protein
MAQRRRPVVVGAGRSERRGHAVAKVGGRGPRPAVAVERCGWPVWRRPMGWQVWRRLEAKTDAHGPRPVVGVARAAAVACRRALVFGRGG